MTRQEIEQLKRRIIQIFIERVKKIEADKERALQAADEMLLSLQDDDQLHLPIFDLTPEPMPLIEAVRDIVQKYAGEFDINRIREIIEAGYPGVKRPLNPTSISNTLKRLCAGNDAKLELVEGGKGKIPARYTAIHRNGNNPNLEEEDFDSLPKPEEEDS